MRPWSVYLLCTCYVLTMHLLCTHHETRLHLLCTYLPCTYYVLTQARQWGSWQEQSPRGGEAQRTVTKPVGAGDGWTAPSEVST